MSSAARRLIDACDNRRVRVIVAVVLGTIAWGLVLVALGRGLNAASVRQPKPEPPLEISVVELPDQASTQPAAATALPAHVASAREASPAKQPLVQPARSRPPSTRPPMAVRPSVPGAHTSAPSPATDPATSSRAQNAAADTPQSQPNSGATAANQPTASATTTAPTTTDSTPGNSPARAISQPLPTVPDDLREQAYRTVALVHLVIHTDGSVAVELVRPTPYPRLNQILLETLRGWRFFPALQNGHPAETQQDVRVHFNVS